MKRRRSKSPPRISQQTWRTVETLLAQQWSPEQIAGRLRYERQETLSPEWIYQHIYADKRRGGTLHLNLRCRRVRRKRYGSRKRRIPIRNRRGIELRPAVVKNKQRIGDWEADTIIGRAHQGALLSLVERKSKLLRLGFVAQNKAAAVTRLTVKMLQPLKVQSITSDNGREFSFHERITARLGAAFYFAHPYCAWERGLNENTNGLVRQYVPKGTDFQNLNWQVIRRIQEKLNHRPRKTLGYLTPHEVFFQQSYALTT